MRHPDVQIYSKLNNYELDFTKICGCLITHAHGDHSKAARDISKRGIPLFATPGTFGAIYCHGTELLNKPVKITEGLYVLQFPVEHDIEGACGFVIKTAKETVIFINDHKKWSTDLSIFKPDYVFIECNYDHKMVYAQMHELERKINTPGFSDKEKLLFQQALNQHTRNLNSHCSLLGTIKGLSKMNLKNTKCIFLMHLSDRHANEYKMKNEVEFATKIRTYVCKKGGGIK